MYSLIELSDNYSETYASLWKYYRDEPSVNNTGIIVDFPGNSALFFILKSGEAGNYSLKDVELIVPLKHLSNF